MHYLESSPLRQKQAVFRGKEREGTRIAWWREIWQLQGAGQGEMESDIERGCLTKGLETNRSSFANDPGANGESFEGLEKEGGEAAGRKDDLRCRVEGERPGTEQGCGEPRGQETTTKVSPLPRPCQ